MRFVRMCLFQVIEFSKTTYFLELVFTTTLVAGIIQRLGVVHFGLDPELGFKRTVAIGMWALAATAAGILGFERFKGTLVYLLHGSRSSFHGVAPTITACATFGLLSFPFSIVTWCFPGAGAINLSAVPAMLGGGVLLWLALVSMSYVIAAVFVATPNALTYEGLLLVPLLVLTGIFTDSVSALARFLVPSAGAFRFFVTGGVVDAVLAILLSGVWIVLAWWLVARFVTQARNTGAVELL